jgi:hypothetical protein
MNSINSINIRFCEEGFERAKYLRKERNGVVGVNKKLIKRGERSERLGRPFALHIQRMTFCQSRVVDLAP